MRRILLASAGMCVFAISIAYGVNLNGNLRIDSMPSHWSYDGGSISGTNYLFYTNSIHTYDTGINIITNEITSGVWPQDYVYARSLSSASYDFLSANFDEEVSSGRLQLLDLNELNNTLRIFYTNYLADLAYWIDYDYEANLPGPIRNMPLNYIAIAEQPIIATNGLIIKKYDIDWVTTPNVEEGTGIGTNSFHPGVMSEVLILDNDSFYILESFGVNNSQDLEYTTNIHYYVSTDNPIPKYYNYTEEILNFSGVEGVGYELLILHQGDFSTNYLNINSGEVAYLIDDSMPYSASGAYTWKGYSLHINYGEIGYPDDGSYGYTPIDEVYGPAQLAISQKTNVYSNGAIGSDGWVLYRIEKTESHYLSAIDSLMEQLSNTISYAESTTFITNTITNSVGHTLSEIADMRLGSQMVSVSNSQALLRFGLDMSDDLTATWQTNAYEIEVEIPATNDVQFFRLRMD